MKSRELDRRRERIARVASKRPEPRVLATHAPRPGTRDALVDLLLELLDARPNSGR